MEIDWLITKYGSRVIVNHVYAIQLNFSSVNAESVSAIFNVMSLSSKNEMAFCNHLASLIYV